MPHLPTSSSARMVAGTSGPTPGSCAGADDDEPKLGRLRLPPPQAPRPTVSAEMTARLAIVRVVPKLAMAFPRIRSGRTRHTANRKTAVGATTTRSLRHWLRQPASYNSLKKGLTALLDRTAARPYFRRA